MDAGFGGGLLVWSLETLELLHKLPLPTNSDVNALVAVHGAVLAGVGADVVLWGAGAL